MSTVNFCHVCRAALPDVTSSHIHTAEDGKRVYVCEKCHKEKRFSIIHKARNLFNKIVLGI